MNLNLMPPQEYFLELQEAIRDQLICESRHVGTTEVVEESEGRVLWKGKVETFMLLGHTTAKRCFAWFSEEPEGTRVIIVLENPPVNGPFSAVKTNLASRQSSAY